MLTTRTRKNVSLLLFIGLLLVSAMVWSMTTDVVAMKDGVYAGVAQGFGGDLVVDVTIDEGKVHDVKVRPHQETPYIAGAAIETLAANIVQAGGTTVDAVSGATVTSKALIAAVDQALQKASGKYEDGMYAGTAQGFGGDLIVDVTVGEGKITAVSVRTHGETPFVADSAIEELTAKIAQAGNANVEVVSGATVTSKALIAAVQEALNGTGEVVEPVLAVSTFEVNVGDGTYRGKAQGYGGELVVDVTVGGGKITEIVIVDNNETPFIAGNALQTLPPAIIEAQGAVDVIGGATVTSKAIIEAVEKALSGEAAPGATYAINVGDGTHRGKAQGYGGELVVDVTVSGGKITEIVVVENSETPFIAGNAFSKLPPAIIEAQGPVDAVSGATVTSKAVLTAVEAALMQ